MIISTISWICVDKGFEPEVKEVLEARNQHKAGERNLGNDPKTGKPVFVKIGRFGPVVQIGSAEDKDKPQFAQLPSDKSIETITLEEALELFKLPRELGDDQFLIFPVKRNLFLCLHLQPKTHFLKIPAKLPDLIIIFCFNLKIQISFFDIPCRFL